MSVYKKLSLDPPPIGNVVDLPVDSDSDGIIEGYTPRIPEGEYRVRYVFHETAIAFNEPKVVIHFGITEGDYAGIELCRYYKVAKLTGPPRKSGAYRVSARSHLVREVRRVIGDIGRLDRVPIGRLRDFDIVARVRDSSGESEYSVIGELLSGSPRTEP